MDRNRIHKPNFGGGNPGQQPQPIPLPPEVATMNNHYLEKLKFHRLVIAGWKLLHMEGSHFRFRPRTDADNQGHSPYNPPVLQQLFICVWLSGQQQQITAEWFDIPTMEPSKIILPEGN